MAVGINGDYYNPLLTTDSYKETQWEQMAPETERNYSYLESRGGMFDNTVMAGVRGFTRGISGKFFNQDDINHATDFCQRHFRGGARFNTEGWQYILDKYEGRLPITVRAVPEGTVVPTHNVLMDMENNDDKTAFVIDFLETRALMSTWYPITVATLSREIKKVLLEFLVKTGEPSNIEMAMQYALQDFGYRASTSEESARIGGAAHLINFKGTDTLAGIQYIENMYDPIADTCAGYSVPASQHSTMTAWGGKEHEVDAMENMLSKFLNGPVSIVSDSYDIYHACERLFGEILREKILSRNGFLVIRPDSGDPKTVIAKCLDILSDKFGYSVNSKGYKILCPKVRLLWGDGINYWSIREILAHITGLGWSADNFACFGMGGGLLQQVNRDTQKFAIKESYTVINGVGFDVFKDPVTDLGKRSKLGRQALVKTNGIYRSVNQKNLVYPLVDELQIVFKDGEDFCPKSFDAVRARAALIY